jgi:uncharacterized membrane protein YcaP (DUF421 family)
VQGEALLLVYQGRLIQDNLKKAELSLGELEEAVREHGVASLEDVDLAVSEIDGNISILSNEYQHRTTRRRKSHKVVSKNV